MSDIKKLLILGNSSSVHTDNLKSLVEGYFTQTVILDNKDFSLHSPLKLIKAVRNAKKLLNSFQPSFIILYQIGVAAFFISFLNRKTPVLAVGIGSDILTVADKSFFNKFFVRYVIKHSNYFNAGSIAIKEKMQSLANRPIEITIANLGTDDILPQKKQNIIFSNRLHKDLYNINHIIDAFAEFLKDNKNKDWKLIIAATGKEQEYMQQVRNLGIEKNTEFVGWLDKQQNAYYYSISKIWVSLPQSDSISISLLEAMSAGCLPVCYDVKALEGFLANNKNAVIVNDFNENFFERAVNLISDDIIALNRKTARQFSDKETNRQRFYSIFDKEFNN
ncbi:MAG: glycosyltransferase [Bacteroidales bacterium]|nr:glycosyltransferase [Bacteroidales bacterium]